MINDSGLQLEATRRISVLLPSRGRPQLAERSIDTLIDTASSVEGIEFLVALDYDDQKSIDHFKNIVTPKFDKLNINMIVFGFSRLGYGKLNEYFNNLAKKSLGKWMLAWNDDAIMTSKNWDLEIEKYDGQFKILGLNDNHGGHPYAIFPVIPREWLILFDDLSPFSAIDAWVSQVAYMTDCIEKISPSVMHDRFDLTGNNKDKTYDEREFLENSPNNESDLNSRKMQDMKWEWARKICWYRKRIGQDTGWFDNYGRVPGFKLFKKMMDNGGDKHVWIGE